MSKLTRKLNQARTQLVPLRGDVLAREKGQALLRVVLATVAAIYLWTSHGPIENWSTLFSVLFLGMIGYSVAVLVLTHRSLSSNPVRRYANNVVDLSVVTFFMVETGEIGVPLFFLYLWVTIGNGFRYGIFALLVSAVLSVLGFSIVVGVTDVWQQHLSFTVGVLFTLIVVPLYAAHLIHMLNTALQRAEEASAAKGRFLARMSHELRTPLNGILGSTDLLDASRRMASEERSLLQVIRDSVQVSLGQINNVLDFSKIEAGKLVLERTNLDLHGVINSAAGMVRPAALQKGLRFLVRVAPETPYRLVGDPHHLRAILLNLLSNAVKFTEQGAVYVDVSGGLDSTANKAVVRVEVRDTGTGISAEALDRIFESFTQEDTSTTRRHGGTGLGTTIAKQLVESMGGRIGVESVKGQGSMFWFEVPFQRQQRAADQQEEASAGMRAILLSENPGLIKYYGSIFKEISGQLVPSPTNEAVLDTLARAMRLGNPVHTVFVDAALAMGADGAHKLEELCDKAASAGVPLVLITESRPFAERLREWGYSAAISPDASKETISAVLHTSPLRAADLEGRVVSVAPWLWGRSQGSKPRILVADDNRTNLMIVRRMLEQAGYDVELAETGDQALERLYAGGFRLAILDMHMPGLDGTTALRQYRTMRPRSRLPVIVLTANASMEAQRECAEAGADAYLSKPVTAADLLAEIERLIRESQVEPLTAHLQKAGAEEAAEAAAEVIDVAVLAELDRLYHDPREMDQIINEYEREGRNLLRLIAQASEARSHPSYCDAVHALKGNAANVGATRLMEICRQAESGGLVSFLRERDDLLQQMHAAFNDTLAALRALVSLPADASRRGLD